MMKKLETKIVKPAITLLLKAMFRVQVKGIENYALAGDKVVIIANHQSFLDPLLLSVFVPNKPAFAMNLHQARKWYFCWVDWFIETYKIDPLAPMSFKRLMTDVKNGTKLVIFPEGRITTTGGIMKIYDGTGRIIEKTGATLLPIHISGAEYSKVSRLGGKIRTRFFPKITITFLPPIKYEDEQKITSQMIYDVMTDANFASSDYRKSLLSALLDASIWHGDGQIIATDISRSTMNYRQLFTRSFILSDKLSEALSDQKFVGILLPNMMGSMVAFVATLMLGKVPAMLNYSAGEINILHACNIATVKTILTSRAFVEKGKLEHIITALEKEHTVIYLEDIRPTVGIFDKLQGLFKAVFARQNLKNIIAKTVADDPCVVLFTSGSEGTPKGVALSHTNIMANINQSRAVLDLLPSDVLFNAMPVFHSFGLTIGMLLPIMCGIRVFLYPSPLHYRVVPELIYDASATIMLGTDTFLNGYARYANAYDFNSIRLAVVGAEKLKESTVRIYADKFRVNLLQGYGVTEASPVISFNTPLANKVGSVGRAFPQIECKLEPVTGMEKGGKLLIKGANIMLGYMKADNAGVIQPQDEWYDTGDIVEIDDNGFITIIGRAKRFAKIAGEMVSLQISEDLATHLFPDATHATIAVADEKKGEHIVLYSDTKELTRDALHTLAKEKGVPDIALPKQVHYLAQIPRLGTGKIDYPSLTKTVSTNPLSVHLPTE